MLKATLPFLLLLLIAGAAFAETATQEATDLASPEADQAPINPPTVLPEHEEATPLAVTAVCVADCCPCAQPAQVTCSGSICFAVDHVCPSQQGYCWSDAEGYNPCPTCACPEPECTARCATGDPPPTNCTCDECCENGGASGGILGIDGKCRCRYL